MSANSSRLHRSTYIAKVVANRSLERPAGLAFAVSERLLLTCAHVVNTALGRGQTEVKRPIDAARLLVEFPFIGNEDHPIRLCRIGYWLAPSSSGKTGDIAVLELVGESLPVDVEIPTCTDHNELEPKKANIFGYPEDPPRDAGVWTECNIRRQVEGGRFQLDASADARIWSQSGFSGSPVVVRKKRLEHVVGMLTLASLKTGDAYMIGHQKLGKSVSAVSVHPDGLRRARPSEQHLSRQSKVIFLVLPAFARKQYFASILDEIVRATARTRFRLVPIFPDPRQQYRTETQERVFRDLVAERTQYVAGIVVPYRPDETRSTINQFVASIRVPLVFLDTLPVSDHRRWPFPNCAYVGTDEREGGRKAAIAAANLLPLRGDVRVDIIPGETQSARRQGFEEELRRVRPRTNVQVTTPVKFERVDGTLRAREIYENGADTENRVTFCANDEVALGVVEYFGRASRADKFPPTQHHVIGYDGIPEARHLILGKSSWLKGTVCHQMKEIAENTVSMINSLLEGEEQDQPVREVRPSFYPPSLSPDDDS